LTHKATVTGDSEPTRAGVGCRLDAFRESGFSKERRLEPQITIGLLSGQDEFPLMVPAFEGNKAETKTMLPVIEAFMARISSRMSRSSRTPGW
jgi:transposase